MKQACFWPVQSTQQRVVYIFVIRFSGQKTNQLQIFCFSRVVLNLQDADDQNQLKARARRRLYLLQKKSQRSERGSFFPTVSITRMEIPSSFFSKRFTSFIENFSSISEVPACLPVQEKEKISSFLNPNGTIEKHFCLRQLSGCVWGV